MGKAIMLKPEQLINIDLTDITSGLVSILKNNKTIDNKDIVINCPNWCTTEGNCDSLLYSLNSGAKGPRTFTLNCNKTSKPNWASSTFYGNWSSILEEIHIPNADWSACRMVSNLFYIQPKLKIIDTVLDFSSVDSSGYQNNPFFGDNELTTVTFAPNCIKYNISFSYSSKLNDKSIISIANALREGLSGNALTLHATVKAKCQLIMGTISMDETQSYHVFTRDESGATTLEEFITNTKGWRIV